MSAHEERTRAAIQASKDAAKVCDQEELVKMVGACIMDVTKVVLKAAPPTLEGGEMLRTFLVSMRTIFDGSLIELQKDMERMDD